MKINDLSNCTNSLITVIFNSFRFLIFIVPTILYGQISSGTDIEGIVISSKGRVPVENATIQLKNITDTALYHIALTDNKGEFKFKNIIPGVYSVKTSHLGFKSNLKTVEVFGFQIFKLDTIVIDEGINLAEVTVFGLAPLISVSNDTTDVNITLLKIARDATVEDMLRNVPGVVISSSGAIMFNGKVVKRIKIEGNDLFNGSIRSVTQNLSADAIKKVQVFDQLTEEDKDRGIDNGKRELVVNLVLKDDKRDKWFGSASVAGGNEKHYLGSASLNKLGKLQQLNVLLLSNNINQSYSADDLSSFTGSDLGTGASSGSSNGINYGNINRGLAKTQGAAFNFFNKWGTKTPSTLKLNYIANSSVLRTDIRSNTQNVLPSGSVFSNRMEYQKAKDFSQGLNVRFTHSFDSLTTMIIAPSIIFVNRNVNVDRTLYTQMQMTPLNSLAQRYTEDSQLPTFNVIMNMIRRFRNKTGSIALNGAIRQSDQSSSVITQSTLIPFQGTNSDLLSQKREESLPSKVYSLTNSNVKKIGRNNSTTLSLENILNISVGKSERLVNDFDSISRLYVLSNKILSNNYDNKLIQYSSVLGVLFQVGKVSVSGLLEGKHLKQEGTSVLNNVESTIAKSFYTLLPRTNLVLRPSKQSSYTFSITSYFRPASIIDLQPVQDNINPIFLRSGNPNLQPEKGYNYSLSFSTYKQIIRQSLNYSFQYLPIFNAISLDSRTDTITGVSKFRTINVDGNYDLMGNFNLGKSFDKGLYLGSGIDFSLNKRTNYLQGFENATHTRSVGQTINLSYAHSNLYDFNFNSSMSYLQVDNSIANSPDTQFLRYFLTGSLRATPIRNYQLKLDFSSDTYLDLTTHNRQNAFLINAGIQRFFSERNKFNLEAKAVDILNKNGNILRVVHGNRIETTKYNGLGRVLYIKFTMKINTKPAEK